ncbi:MAG: dephospho-CoA kinase [Cytophagaceae bacterium]
MSKRPLKIGITGGIGSGKTTVCKVFQLVGVPVYNADSRAKWLMNYNSEIRKSVISEFGEKAYQNDELNSSFIAAQVFGDQTRLEKLNSIVHPAVGHDFADWCGKQTNVPYVLKEAALLFEAGTVKDLDRVITVFSPKELRVSRILDRDKNRTENDVLKIMENQMPDEEKIKKSDHIIFNDLENMVIPQVLKLHELFVLLYEKLPSLQAK